VTNPIPEQFSAKFPDFRDFGTAEMLVICFQLKVMKLLLACHHLLSLI